jgi:hypothetical protein
MDRTGYTDVGALEAGLFHLYLVFTAGTSGAIPTTFTYNAGFGSVTLSSPGAITVHLQDSYVALVQFDGSIQQGTFDKTHACEVDLKTDLVADATDPRVVVEMRTDDGTAALADMATGDIFRLHLTLKAIAESGF